jgi:hypothetical protein
MFRSTTIIRELVLSMAKVILKHSVKYVVIYFLNMLPHHHIARLITSSLMMVVDRNM